MKREYEGYFSLRLRDLTRPYYWRRRYDPEPIYPFFYVVIDRIPEEWRADAKFFLASNMLEMVLAPYDAVERRADALFPGDAVWKLIIEDLDALIARSEEISKSRGRSYVSSTSVAVALGELAEKLQTNSLQIWGPSEE